MIVAPVPGADGTFRASPPGSVRLTSASFEKDMDAERFSTTIVAIAPNRQDPERGQRPRQRPRLRGRGRGPPTIVHPLTPPGRRTAPRPPAPTLRRWSLPRNRSHREVAPRAREPGRPCPWRPVPWTVTEGSNPGSVVFDLEGQEPSDSPETDHRHRAPATSPRSGAPRGRRSTPRLDILGCRRTPADSTSRERRFRAGREARHEPLVGQQRRVDAAGQVAEVLERRVISPSTSVNMAAARSGVCAASPGPGEASPPGPRAVAGRRRGCCARGAAVPRPGPPPAVDGKPGAPPDGPQLFGQRTFEAPGPLRRQVGGPGAPPRA
jgi:hypothetical protein